MGRSRVNRAGGDKEVLCGQFSGDQEHNMRSQHVAVGGETGAPYRIVLGKGGKMIVMSTYKPNIGTTHLPTGEEPLI